MSRTRWCQGGPSKDPPSSSRYSGTPYHVSVALCTPMNPVPSRTDCTIASRSLGGGQREGRGHHEEAQGTAARMHLRRFYSVRSRAFVPGTMLHRRGEPDALVVLLEDALARDLLLRAHPRVLRLRRARVVAAVQVRRRDQAPHSCAAARTGLERRVLHAVSSLVDDPTRLTLVFVGRHHVLRERARAAGEQRRPPGTIRRRRPAAAPPARRWSWS